MLIYNVHLCTN